MHDHEQQSASAVDPPVPVPAGLPAELTRIWVTFLRAIGDALRTKVGEPDLSSRMRIASAIQALIPYDDILVGRIEPDGQMIWMRPTDEHECVSAADAHGSNRAAVTGDRRRREAGELVHRDLDVGFAEPLGRGAPTRPQHDRDVVR